MHGHRKYIGHLWSAALSHADTAGNTATVAQLLLLAVGVSGLANAFVEQLPGGSIYAVGGFVGLLYIASKHVWDTDQQDVSKLKEKIEDYERRSPLSIVGTSPDGFWKRLVVHNPNGFPVAGAYVKVKQYTSTPPLDAKRYPLPAQGFKFNWGTHQDNPNGNIGANSTLILDVILQGGDLFYHAAPSRELRKVDPAYPLPYGLYLVVVELGATGTTVPPSYQVIQITFTDAYLDIAMIAADVG